MAEDLTLATILEKNPADLTEEEVAHLNEFKSQLNQEQLEKFSEVFKNDEEEGEDLPETKPEQEEQKTE